MRETQAYRSLTTEQSIRAHLRPEGVVCIDIGPLPVRLSWEDVNQFAKELLQLTEPSRVLDIATDIRAVLEKHNA